MAASDKLLVTLEGGVKRITFNRPARRNAVDHETFALLREAMQEAAQDDSRVIILTGAGDSFSAGADLTALTPEEIERHDVTASLRDNINPSILAMREVPKPVIARVHGHAAGIGCNYALACDIIVASHESFFSELFVRIGLMPDGGGTYFLPRLVGYHRAFELMATGEAVSADDAYKMGIVNRVVPYDQLDAAVDKLAARLAQAPAIALAGIKRGLNHGMNADLAAALDFEAVNQGNCFRSADFREGVAAFLEKRKAVFTGK
jgi:2-(1,2-epoxy-1,2-dihydrophenyl)acetyl-CoA isomerase